MRDKNLHLSIANIARQYLCVNIRVVTACWMVRNHPFKKRLLECRAQKGTISSYWDLVSKIADPQPLK